jgi:hypothetical protein
MRTSRSIYRRQFSIAAALAFLLALVAPTAALADTTVAIDNIRTQVGAIDTHVDSVTYSDPVLVEVPNVGRAWELRGTVHGVGWGGAGIVARARNAHYTYDITWLARWPKHGRGKMLVIFHHGGPPTAIAIAQADRALGAANHNRFAERLGDDNAGIATLVQGGTYISANRRGLVADGRFAAKFLTSEVAPLTQAEVDQVRAAIAPGDATYSHPDLVAGAPVPATIAVDTATVRDVDRALQQIVAQVSATRFRERISAAVSAGATATSGIAFGCSAIDDACVRTGGNHWSPYDTSSPPIFDGFIFTGFIYDSATERADAGQPLSAPVFILQGRGDDRYQQPIRMAHELMQKGVNLEDSIWLYELANMPHVPRDTTLAVPPSAYRGEAMGAYLGAAIRNMRELLAGKAAPPRSRIAGRIVNDALVFDVVGGTTDQMPVREDPAFDGADFGPGVFVRVVDAAATARWEEVTAALDHDDEPIVGPTIACRIGGYQLRFLGTLLTPFSPAELAARFGSFAGYRACVRATVQALKADRLYDPRFESAQQTATRAQALFNE